MLFNLQESSFTFETIGNVNIDDLCGEDLAAELSPNKSGEDVSADDSLANVDVAEDRDDDVDVADDKDNDVDVTDDRSDDNSVADGSVSCGSGESQVSESLWPVSDISHLEMDTSLTFNEYSYIQPDISMSELDISYIAPTYSPVRSPGNEHSSPGQLVTTDYVAQSNGGTVLQQPSNDTNDRAVAVDGLTAQSNAWSGFKITIDNVDKNFRPSFQRVHHQTKSLHCVHMYATKDRLDLSHFSNTPPRNVTITQGDILPSDSDLCNLKEHFKVLVARYVC